MNELHLEVTPLSSLDVPEVLEVHVVPSEEVRMVPEVPTATNNLEVVNPLEVSYWLPTAFPAESFTPVVTRILYVVEEDKLDEGVTVNVLLELEADGEEAIRTQELKLSEDT